MFVNWMASTFILNDNESSLYTTFQNSSLKKQKYKFHLEMLPTLEILKTRHLSLYSSNLLCCRCSVTEETFNHIWLCSASSNPIWALINSTRQLLFSQLVELIGTDSIIDDHIRPLSLSSIWDLNPRGSNFCFIDVIKGIVPTDFYNHIFDILQNKQLTLSLISMTYHHVFEHTFTI